jgi:hypothetical protein
MIGAPMWPQAPEDVRLDVDDAVAAAHAYLERQQLPSLAHGSGGFWSATWIAIREGARSLRNDARGILTTAARHSPIVLVVLVVLFVTAETWEVFGTMRFGPLVLVVLLLALLTLGTSVLAILEELSPVNRTATRPDPGTLEELVHGLGDARPATRILVRHVPIPVCRQGNRRFQLRKGEQWNIFAVLAAPLAMAGLLFGALVFGFFLLLWQIALDPGTLNRWMHRDAGDPVAAPAMQVSAVLAALAWLTLAIEVLRDEALRERLMGDDCRQMRRLVALATYCKAWRA